MKSIRLLFIVSLLATILFVVQSQDKVMQVHSGGNVVYEVKALQVDSVVFIDDISTGLTQEGRLDINKDEFITMRVLPKDVFVNSSMKLIIENKAKGDLLFGQDFSLEYFDKENWERIQLDINFEYIGYILKANETLERPFYVSENCFSKLGIYRIVKKFTYSSNFLSEENYAVNSFSLYVEFEIKQN